MQPVDARDAWRLARKNETCSNPPVSGLPDHRKSSAVGQFPVSIRAALYFVLFGLWSADDQLAKVLPLSGSLAYPFTMQGLWLLNILSIFTVFSPPILLGIAWARFLKREAVGEQPKWRHVLGAANLLAVSLLLGVSIVKFFGMRCNVDSGDWSCVVAWRSFTRLVVLSAPFLLALATLGAKRTRILSFVSILAIVFDVMLVDTMP